MRVLGTVRVVGGAGLAGHRWLQSLEKVGTGAVEPCGVAIALVVRGIGRGGSEEGALERLGDRVRSGGLGLIVSAFNVHHQSGGSLAKVLDAISETIRERVRVSGDIRGLTAQQRYSAYVLSLLPVVAAGALFLFSPSYASVLLAPGALRIALIAASGMVVAGFLVMNRLARIDV